MKGVLLFNSVNDVIFFKADEALSKHLLNLARKDNLIEEESGGAKEVGLNKDIILHIFIPLITSYRFMQCQFGSKQHTIETDGITLAFRELLGHIVIGISDARSVGMIQKEISMFIIFVNLLFGSSLHLMNKISSTYGGLSRVDLLSSLLDQWHCLRADSQMFLVEAIEKVLVNADITAKSVDLLQTVLHKIRTSHKGGVFRHSFLLVDYRLLALYSSRNSDQLLKEQLLVLIIVSMMMRTVTYRRSSEYSSSPNVTDEITELKDEPYNSLLLFLHAQLLQQVPFIVYTVNITEKITLVILCELVNRSSLCSSLSLFIGMLHNIQCIPSCRLPLCSFESLETLYKNIFDTVIKFKDQPGVTRYINQLPQKWQHMEKNGIKEYLMSTSNNYPDVRLECAVRNMTELCTNIYGDLVTNYGLSNETTIESPDNRQLFASVQEMVKSHLQDSMSYLETKAECNCTMSSYISEYPGLVHFIYVDRTSGFIIAPSEFTETQDVDHRTSLKYKIWKMVNFVRKYVNGAKTFHCICHKEDLRYSYKLWFEDESGKNIKPSHYPDLEGFPPPGILCGDYYKMLIQKCFPNASVEHICCYEFFCIYLDSTPIADIVKHSKQLPMKLWSLSAAYRSSLDLLY